MVHVFACIIRMLAELHIDSEPRFSKPAAIPRATAAGVWRDDVT